jgi:putative membrane protein
MDPKVNLAGAKRYQGAALGNPDRLDGTSGLALRGDCVINAGNKPREGTMIGNILVGLVALIHCYIVYLEMVLWDTPRGRKAFGLTPEFASASKVLAANQGLYNGFLAAGLIWGLYLGAAGFQIKMFFLLCVAIAGLYGAATVGRKILYIQTVPAALAIVALWLGL